MDQVLSKIPFTDDFEGIRDKLIIELLYTTGIPRAELVGLKLVNLDLHQSNMRVLGKRNKERIVPLLDRVVELFKVYLELSLVKKGEWWIFIVCQLQRFYFFV